MLCAMGGYSPNHHPCPIVTIVHDCQVFACDQLPASLFGAHDFPLDLILTPTRTIHCKSYKPARDPPGIIWSLLSEERLSEIPILRELKIKQQQ